MATPILPLWQNKQMHAKPFLPRGSRTEGWAEKACKGVVNIVSP